MSATSERTKHKAQVYDVALSGFFKARDLDAASLNTSKTDIGWDIAEAMVAAAISGVTYKSSNTETLTDAAMLLRGLADQVEENGLADLEWGYRGDMLSRHAWRPDIRTTEGLAELDRRTEAVIEGMMGPTRSLSVPEKRVIVCLSFVRMAVAQVGDLIDQEPQSAEVIRAMATVVLAAQMEDVKTTDLAKVDASQGEKKPNDVGKIQSCLACSEAIGETRRVKKSLDHLPLPKQSELRHVVDVIRASFEEAISTRRAERLKNGKILKVVLYGSYARGDWVHDPVGRYFSDFDLLVLVDHEDLTEGEFWFDANNRTLPGEGEVRTPVSIIVHTLDDVNDQLDRGRYFFADIVRDGIVLHDSPGAKLHKPATIKAKAALAEAEGYFAKWMHSSKEFQAGAAFYVQRDSSALAAFSLHQAAEHLYHCILLVVTLYSGKAHNLAFLRKKAEAIDPRLAEAWPREAKFERRCFELLREAYVKARYSEHYKITAEELAWLTERVEVLRVLAVAVCEDRLRDLRDEVSGDGE
nr:nucleotidyltransferase and HEPN domain-containing protein [uncultured Brevundimonas sp.]